MKSNCCKNDFGHFRATVLAILIGLFFLSSCTAQEIHPAATQPTTLARTDSDEALQKAATAALGEREGAIAVIDPQTGRLRAVVNPRLVFEQAYPPGSAIKPFTAHAALRAGTLHPDDRRLCQTRFARAGFEIVCSHPKSKTPFNLAQALAYSCNDYFAHVGERLSEGNFNAALRSFGFGARTGATANESSGRLPEGDWRAQDALGEGDRLLVTPIQLLMAYAALVNGGHLYRPQRSKGSSLIPQETTRLSISPTHRATLIEGMRGAIKYGTAERAELDQSPFYIFGKTGTSTASNGFRTQGWFVGFAAEKPATGAPRPEQIKLGVLVFLKRAHGSQGAEIAKMIFENATQTGIATEAATTEPMHSAFSTQHSALIKVRSISEKITRELPLEEYLVGVLAGESSIENELEALKAQAVISRTFAWRNAGRHTREGYDFCSTTHCQRFTVVKAGASSLVRRAVAATSGEVLLDRSNEPIDAYFHAACGGMTANIESLWAAPARDYLRGVRDEFCAAMPHYRWTQTIPAAKLAEALQTDERAGVGARLDSIVVRKRDASGRAEQLALSGTRRVVVRGWDFKLIVGRSLGWQMIKSSLFEVSKSGGDFIFRGGGFGHGLGLCQEGAHVMARRRMSYRQIVSHYFPGTRLSQTDFSPRSGRQHKAWSGARSAEPQVRDELVHQAREASDRPLLLINPDFQTLSAASQASLILCALNLGFRLAPPQALCFRPLRGLGNYKNIDAFQLSTLSSEHFRANFKANSDSHLVEAAIRILEAARLDLLDRLHRAGLQLPESRSFEIVIHATTSEFIAATGQSGWAAGATRGRRIELQPLSLLQKRGILATTLRHELTHAAVEILSKGRAPRWLSEGLAIHVASEGRMMINTEKKISREELERRLAKPLPVKESRELYAAAYREVQAMIQTNGESHLWRLTTK